MLLIFYSESDRNSGSSFLSSSSPAHPLSPECRLTTDGQDWRTSQELDLSLVRALEASMGLAHESLQRLVTYTFVKTTNL